MRKLSSIVLALAMLAGFGGAVAGPAAADVLIHQPPSTLCLGRSFEVGAWYQAYSGGPRDFRIEVYDPSGRLVLYRSGMAVASRWKLWTYRPRVTGRYRVVYSGSSWRPLHRTRPGAAVRLTRLNPKGLAAITETAARPSEVDPP